MVEFLGPIGLIAIGALFIFIATNKDISRKIPKTYWYSLIAKGETRKEEYEGMQMLLFIPGAFLLGIGLVLLALYFLG
jgi:hypothetical protein